MKLEAIIECKHYGADSSVTYVNPVTELCKVCNNIENFYEME